VDRLMIKDRKCDMQTNERTNKAFISIDNALFG